MDITVIVFVLVYLVMAVGHLPGFKVDRTGAALLGGMVLIVAGRIGPTAAWDAIDFNTIGLLFGLLVVSSSFVAAGFYDWVAVRLGELKVGPERLLAMMILVSGVFSAVLTNDVVMVAMIPVLCAITLARGLNPVPFLLGLCFAANVGSTATLIGSPRNMIIAETLKISFVEFSRLTWLPTVLSLGLVWLVLVLLYRKRWQLDSVPPDAIESDVPSDPEADLTVSLDHVETVKAGVVTLGVMVAFIFTDWPHVLIALGAASLLLLNRKISSHDLLKHVDGNLLLLLMGLFVVNAAISTTGLPAEIMSRLHAIGINLHSPIQALLISAGISDAVGNSPTIMLLAPFISTATQHVSTLGAAISIGTGFSSNAVIFGSLAGIIAVEQAKARGVIIGFGEFARSGLPITVISLVLGIGWIHWMAG